MPSLVNKISYEYDSTYSGYRNHNKNIPELNNWIDSLIAQTEYHLPSNTNPTTEVLVQALQRYDTIFCELLRQNLLFTEPLTKLFGKTWSGSFDLINYVIKSYHRYVKHTSHLQHQAQQLLNERLAQVAASKVKEEEFELERTALRARIRNLEAEIDVLNQSNHSLERDNDNLRLLVTTYIRGDGNIKNENNIWDILDDYYTASQKIMFQKPLVEDDDIDDNESDSYSKSNRFGFRRKDIIDENKLLFVTLNKIDIEINNTLAAVIKEENRQKIIISDLMKLFAKNRDIFGEARWKLGRLLPGEISITKTVDADTQVDGSDVLGVVNDLTTNYLNDIDASKLPPPPRKPQMTLKIVGSDYPYQFRKLLTSFPLCLRIPPAAWVCETIFTIYRYKCIDDKIMISKNLPIPPIAVTVTKFFRETLKVTSSSDAQLAQFVKACEYHMNSVRRVAVFASQLGLTDKDMPPQLDIRDTKFILAIIECLDNDVDTLETTISKLSTRDSKLNSDEPVSVIYSFNKEFKLGDNTLIPIRPIIPRKSALKAVQYLFHQLLPDGAIDTLIKVSNLTAVSHYQLSDQTVDLIDIDEFISILLELWQSVRVTLEDHAKHLFTNHCSVYRVVTEAQFANDLGAVDRDCVVIQVSKAAALDAPKRPLRVFHRQDKQIFAIEDDNQGNSAIKDYRKKALQGAGKKEAVCELISRKSFGIVSSIMYPDISTERVNAMFSEACENSHNTLLRTLEQLWVRYIDTESDLTPMNRKDMKATNLPYYVNVSTSQSQWTPPYRNRSYYSQEIEMDSFVTVVILNDLLLSSPYVELLTRTSPKDLWSNADYHLKRIKAEQHEKEQQSKLLNDIDKDKKLFSGVISDEEIAKLKTIEKEKQKQEHMKMINDRKKNKRMTKVKKNSRRGSRSTIVKSTPQSTDSDD
eukprot:gene17264-22796_t